ncbi:hypothetical protein LP420_15870 [Massilia sp. B-10]|nr:hypothetical protein LP420_15870 [Massilia sp. B-10]
METITQPGALRSTAAASSQGNTGAARHCHHAVLHVGAADLPQRRADPAPQVGLHAHLCAGDAGAVLLLRRLLRGVAA